MTADTLTAAEIAKADRAAKADETRVTALKAAIAEMSDETLYNLMAAYGHDLSDWRAAGRSDWLRTYAFMTIYHQMGLTAPAL